LSDLVRAAGIDCGTNSIRLLIADVDLATGRAHDVVRLMEVVRLGEGVDRTGQFAPAALERTLAQVRRYGEICRDRGVKHLRFVGTSASRDASNRAVFIDGVARELGVAVDVVDGLEEARLSFAGALSGLDPASGGVSAPYLCVDLGGGSTELVLGAERPEQAFSMDVGCVRITERHLREDPPTQAEVRAAIGDIDAVIDRAAQDVDLGRTGTLVGLAGSITTITAHALDLPVYDPALVDGAVLSVDAVLRACRELWEWSRAQRAALGVMHPGRVDVIGGGALVWSRVIERVRAEVRSAGRTLDTIFTSEHDILDGITQSAAHQSLPWTPPTR
jgi:exopolyphosphatase/guanosine-5'-triphosphate,3'-diphosphate pyrophosphatase